MEEIIKLRDYGFEVEDKQDEENETESVDSFSFKKKTTIGDIIIFQFIVCVIIIIALIVTKYLYSDISDELFDNLKSLINTKTNIKQEIVNLFSTIMGFINVKI